jgi:plastocyanin
LRTWLSAVLLLFASVAVACSGGSSEPEATATSVQVATSAEASATPQPEATSAPVEASPTAEPTATPEPTSTPEPTATPVPPTQPPAPTQPPPAPTTPPAPAGIAAPIRSNGFPYQLTVPAGSTVVWTNYDPVPHDVTAKDGSWSSGLLGQGESFAHTFNEPGTFAYICQVHPFMSAVLIVE